MSFDKQWCLNIEDQIQDILKRINTIDEEIHSNPVDKAFLLPFKHGMSTSKPFTYHKKERLEQSASSLMEKHMHSFWKNISLPGFKYMGEHGRSDKYMWMIVLTISLLVSGKYIDQTYKKWQKSPVLLSFNDRLTSIATIPYPAVTFCPGKPIRSDYDFETKLNACKNDTCTQTDLESLDAVRHLCPNSKFRDSLDDLLKERQYVERPVDAFEFIKELTPTCEDTIKNFKFYKDKSPPRCSDAFQTIYLNGAVCYSFNLLPARDMYHDNVSAPVIDETSVTSKLSWSPEVNYEFPDLNRTVPRYLDSNGEWGGLDIEANIPDEMSFDCENDQEVKLIVHHPADLPRAETHQFVNVPKGEFMVRLNPDLVTASEELYDYTPITRGCYFSHERNLSLFRLYTQRNCKLECRANCTLNVCGCVPFYLPRINSSIPVCAPPTREPTCAHYLLPAVLEERYGWKFLVLKHRDLMGTSFQNRFKDYIYKGVDKNFNKTGNKEPTGEMLTASYHKCACDCPPACTFLDYNLDTRPEPFPEFIDSSSHTHIAAISFKELEFSSVIRKELIGFSDFVADSGGVLGVFTGFSFLAMVELLYYLTFRLWSSIKQWQLACEQF